MTAWAEFPPPLPWDVSRQNGAFGVRGTKLKKMVALEYWKDRVSLEKLVSVGSTQTFSCYNDDGEPTYAYCLDFDPTGRLVLGQEDGQICILETGTDHQTSSANRVKCVSAWSAHNNAIYDVRWLRGQDSVISVAGDNSVRHWNVERQEALAMAKPPKVTEHTGCLKCLALPPTTASSSSPKFVSGGRDNAIIHWDLRSPQPAVLNVVKYSHKPTVLTLKKSAAPPTKASVTALDFIDEHHVVSCSDLDGVIKVWDLRMSYDRYTGLPKSKHAIPYAGKKSGGLRGYSSLVLNAARTKVYASCQDHTIYRFDISQCDSVRPEKTFAGHTNGPRFYTKLSLSLDDRYLLTGSADNDGYIYNTSFNAPARPVGKLRAHASDVTCVAFSRQPNDPYKVVTCGDDFEVKLWSVNHMTDEEKTLHDGEFEWISGYADYLALSNAPVDDTQMDADDRENTPTGKSKRPLSPLSKKRRLMTSPLSETNGHQKPARNRLDAFPCISPRKLEIVSPTKKVTTPVKLNVTPKKRLDFNDECQSKKPWASPTINLPNLVENGKSPHDKNKAAVAPKPRRALDWLSTMSRLRQISIDSSGDNDAKKSPSTSSTTSTQSPKRGRKRKTIRK